MQAPSRSRLWRTRGRRVPPALLLLAPMLAAAQTPDLKELRERLERLEALSLEIRNEIRLLREQLPGAVPAAAREPEPPLAERIEIQERRTAELDQSKVSIDHRLPVTLSGMVLFNAFWNGQASGGGQYPVVALPAARRVGAGATLRQTIVGLKFDGPRVAGGGRITGAAYMDFFGGGTGLDQFFRLRVARLNADWKNTSLTFAFDKPLIAQRDPDSLAQVGVSPLTGAGNLWLWQPQVRFEQRFPLGEQAGLRAQFSVYQTAESTGTGLAAEYGDTLAASRPGYQGRFEFFSQAGGSRRIEIAPGFHASSTRVLGVSVPSRIFTVDWLVRPASRIDFSGTFFQGRNVGVIGGLRQGVAVYRERYPMAVRATGGWAQLQLRITPRLTWNGFAGQEDGRNSILEAGRIGKNQSYGANLMYRWGSNVVSAVEVSQLRTSWIGGPTRVNPHYDLAIAYLF